MPKEELNVGSVLFVPRHPLSQKSGERGQGDKLPMSVVNVMWHYALSLVLSFTTPNKTMFWHTSGSDKQPRSEEWFSSITKMDFFIFDSSCTCIISKLTCTSLLWLLNFSIVYLILLEELTFLFVKKMNLIYFSIKKHLQTSKFKKSSFLEISVAIVT